mmetsp:Transcript_25899/g.43485  ORF Transcript_25899/g.43485 Transcript_25899/m.43485 type:complete len:522 (+) Transcript_25899:126-1691(+)
MDWIFSREFLEDEERCQGNVDKERQTRFKTVWFMKDLTDSLRPKPKSLDRKEDELEFDIRNLKVFWTACTFFHRYYVFHSFEQTSRFEMATACLFLASKVEEKPLRLSDHVIHYFCVRKGKFTVKKTDPEYLDIQQKVLNSERFLLQTLNFDLNVTHPHNLFRQIITRELKPYFGDGEDSKQVNRLATSLLTDSMRSTLCLLYSPHQLAFGLILLALIIMSLQPSSSSSSSSSGVGSSGGVSGKTGSKSGTGILAEASWLDILEKDIDEAVLKDICFTMVKLYEDSSFKPEQRAFAPHSPEEVKGEISKQIGIIQASRQAFEAENPDTSTEEHKSASSIVVSTTSTAEMMPPPSFSSSSIHMPPPSGVLSATAAAGSTSSATINNTTAVTGSTAAAGSETPADIPPPPPLSRGEEDGEGDGDEPLVSGSYYHTNHHDGDTNGRDDEGYIGLNGDDTPAFLPPPSDTPGSMAATPTFDSIATAAAAIVPQQQQQQQQQQQGNIQVGVGATGLHMQKRARIEY